MKGIVFAQKSISPDHTPGVNPYLSLIFDKPLILSSVEALKRSSVEEILILTNKTFLPGLADFLGNGSTFGVKIRFQITEKHNELEALSEASSFFEEDLVAVISGTEVFDADFTTEALYFQKGSEIFVKTQEPREGQTVIEISSDGSVDSMEHAPNFPKANKVLMGLYFFDRTLSEKLKSIEKKSEKRILDVLNLYRAEKHLSVKSVTGNWISVHSPVDLLEASLLHQESLDIRAQKSAVIHSMTEKKELPKVSIGVLLHNSEKYVKACFDSLLAQDYPNFEIVVLDNASEDHSRAVFLENFGKTPSTKIRMLREEKNIGFGNGHNRLIRETKSDFYFCANIDMIFEKNFVGNLVKSMQDQPNLGATGGKLKRWDFDAFSRGQTGKTNFLDSVGISFLSNHRFEDMGQGDADFGQFEESREVFGISGAAVLLRRSALDDIAIEETGQPVSFFDPLMFAYKEDVDLAYRLQWAGWKAKFLPQAVAYHDRTARTHGRTFWQVVKNRFKKPAKINRYSFLNHKILLQKNFSQNFSFKILARTFAYNTKLFFYLLVFETETLLQWFRLIWMRGRINDHKKQIKKRISAKEMEKFMMD